MLTEYKEMMSGPRYHAGLVYLVPQAVVAGVKKVLRFDNPEGQAAMPSGLQAHSDEAKLRDP